MGILSWWNSVSMASEASDMIGSTDLSEDSLYTLAEEVGAPDPDAFVHASQTFISDAQEDQRIAAEGSWFEKAARWIGN